MSELSALILAVGWVVGCWVLRGVPRLSPIRPPSVPAGPSPDTVPDPDVTQPYDDELTEFQHWLEEGGHAFSEDVQLQVEWAFGRLVGRDAEQGSEELAREILTRWASPGG